MKTAVSVPENLFCAAEQHAKRTQKSRSRLYAEALAEYLDHHAPDEVTEAMNGVLDRVGESRPDSFLVAVGRQAFERVPW